MSRRIETCYISGSFGFGVGDIIVFDDTTFGLAGGLIKVSGPTSRRPLPPIRDGGTTINATTACPALVPNCSEMLPGPVTISAGLSLAAADDGLSILTSYNVIRGVNITFFPDDGIEIQGGIGNRIEGCQIGVAGGNSGDGIDDSGFSDIIGGTTAAQRNILSGNLDNGIIGRNPGLVIQGNFIGTDPTGSFSLGNALSGIRLESAATEAIIGGSGAGNIISGNGNGISSASNSATIQGNIIGRDSTNSFDLPNGADGINITGRFNLVGGTTAGSDNAIRGNLLDGVQLGGTNNTIEGNDTPGPSGYFIGGNGRHGVSILANTNVVGSADSGAGNLIVGNSKAGVRLEASTSSIVHGNTIEGNGEDGVQLDSTSNSNTIGGNVSGAANVIDSNGGAGVFVTSGTANAILSNSIFANGGLGIDLAPAGVNPNDTGDADAGPNNLQNFPVLTAAVTASNTVVTGTLNTQINSSFTLHFYSNTACNASGNGEGETLLGSVTTTTNSTGNGSFTMILSTIVPIGQFITATATHSTNNTSEFSECIVVTSCPVITLTAPPLGDGTIGVSYTTIIVATGGAAPYAFSITSGTLPSGLSLNTSTGEISGIPIMPGIYSFDITVMDSTGCTASQSYTINVVCGAIGLTAPPLPAGVISTPYSTTVTASGGTAPYSFSVTDGSIPTGTSLSADGTLSGTPIVGGSFDFTITATDTFGCTGVQDYSVFISSLLSEDFGDGIMSWDVTKGSWSESGGNLIAIAKATAFASIPWSPSGVAGCSLCIIQVDDIMIASNGDVRVVGWYVDNKNKVELVLKEGKIILKQFVAGAIVINTKTSVSITAGTPFDVKLSFDGVNFEVLIDGSLALTESAGGLPTGKVGLTVKKGTATFGAVSVF